MHPLDPLTPEEIAAVSLEIKKYAAAKTEIKAIKFLTADILAPAKKDVLAYLGIPISPDAPPSQPPEVISRRAEVDFVDLVTGCTWNTRLIITDEVWRVSKLTKLPAGVHPQITPEELLAAEQVIRNDPKVIELAAAVGVSSDQLHADGWSIGYDTRFPESIRLQQCLLYARLGKDENLYAHPLDFFPVIDSNSLKVIHIDFAPHRIGPDGTLSVPTTSWADLSTDAFQAVQRPRIKPPLGGHNFLPDLIAKQPGFDPNLRPEIKPLHILQPQGVSFSVHGHEVAWQNWRFHASFSHREGIVISTVTYNDKGTPRPILYRLNLSEMVVPYAAPEHPHPRKFAFDVGEYGMGTQANELSLGCDCLGKIHYLPGVYIGNEGNAIHVKNAICIHEEDAGLLWKHTDFRIGGRSHSVRSRRLSISMICTVANYEYCFYYYFYLDGTIELEIRLTGILNAYVLAEGESAAPFGTAVAPGINAQYHSHIFSIRIDPMIDGLLNSVVETDILPYGFATGSSENFAGNAFIANETVLSTSERGVRDWNADTDRRWTIINPSRHHYSSGKPVGYILGLKGGVVRLLGQNDGWASRRAAFANHTLWVVRDRMQSDANAPERLFPAGKYVPQTRVDPQDSVTAWSAENASIDNQDILLFTTIGLHHIPRPEDWPVMPSEFLRMSLKPVNFFKQNPSLDVPGAFDQSSTHAFEGECSNK